MNACQGYNDLLYNGDLELHYHSLRVPRENISCEGFVITPRNLDVLVAFSTIKGMMDAECLCMLVYLYAYIQTNLQKNDI